MKVFKELEIEIITGTVSVFVDALTSRITMPWTRDLETENRLNESGNKFFCFQRASDPILPGAMLCLVQDNVRMYVPNIVPNDKASLSFDEYNNILTEFYEKFVVPVANETNTNLYISSGDITIDEVVTEAAYKALQDFSRLANRSTGSSHPLDKQRWFKFLIAIHKSEKPLQTELLKRHLLEDGWPEDTVFDLIAEYDFAHDLLKYYDEH